MSLTKMVCKSPFKFLFCQNRVGGGQDTQSHSWFCKCTFWLQYFQIYELNPQRLILLGNYSVSCWCIKFSLQAMLVGIVHHVCGEHEWGLSQCLHGPLSDQEPKTYLTKNSKPVEALREIIFDKKLLSSLHFYTHFRLEYTLTTQAFPTSTWQELSRFLRMFKNSLHIYV